MVLAAIGGIVTPSYGIPTTTTADRSGREGFLGIGRANGGPYQGPFSHPWNYAEMIVMNVFDPCAVWTYAAPEITGITPDNGMLGRYGVHH